MFLICIRPHVTVCLKAYITFWVEASYVKVPPFHVGDYWLHASGGVKYLICHVTSPNLMIEESCNFMSGNLSLHVVEI